MKFILIAIYFHLNLAFLPTQDVAENNIYLRLSSRVDTSSVEVKTIIALYENYFRSNPEKIHDNPFWNKKEKEQYEDFDFSRASIFQGGMDAETLFQYYSPFVLSVEPIKEKYQIRVLYGSETSDPKYVGSKVWCIHKLNAVKEDGKWVLENLIVEISKDWSNRKIGFIEYIYPPNHVFDSKKAREGSKFCEDIIRRFNPGYNESFKYYVTGRLDDMGLLENFDYYFVGMTEGKAREGMILSAKGDESYPHEFVHKLLPSNQNRGHVIEEGLAVFLGTRTNMIEYKSIMNKLAFDLTENCTDINFNTVLSQKVIYNGYQTAYPAGAGICELVYQVKGDRGLSQLMQADTSNFERIVQSVCTILSITPEEFEMKWLDVISAYNAK